MTSAAWWTIVAAAGGATVLLKGIGPVALGGRRLPDRVMGVIALLGPAVLAALIVAQSVAGVGLVEAQTQNIAVGAPLSALVIEVPAQVKQRVKAGAGLYGKRDLVAVRARRGAGQVNLVDDREERQIEVGKRPQRARCI